MPSRAAQTSVGGSCLLHLFGCFWFATPLSLPLSFLPPRTEPLQRKVQVLCNIASPLKILEREIWSLYCSDDSSFSLSHSTPHVSIAQSSLGAFALPPHALLTLLITPTKALIHLLPHGERIRRGGVAAPVQPLLPQARALPDALEAH